VIGCRTWPPDLVRVVEHAIGITSRDFRVEQVFARVSARLLGSSCPTKDLVERQSALNALARDGRGAAGDDGCRLPSVGVRRRVVVIAIGGSLSQYGQQHWHDPFSEIGRYRPSSRGISLS
jgi:hypothetical protein